jgi:hypothetical protein
MAVKYFIPPINPLDTYGWRDAGNWFLDSDGTTPTTYATLNDEVYIGYFRESTTDKSIGISITQNESCASLYLIQYDTRPTTVYFTGTFGLTISDDNGTGEVGEIPHALYITDATTKYLDAFKTYAGTLTFTGSRPITLSGDFSLVKFSGAEVNCKVIFNKIYSATVAYTALKIESQSSNNLDVIHTAGYVYVDQGTYFKRYLGAGSSIKGLYPISSDLFTTIYISGSDETIGTTLSVGSNFRTLSASTGPTGTTFNLANTEGNLKTVLSQTVLSAATADSDIYLEIIGGGTFKIGGSNSTTGFANILLNSTLEVDLNFTVGAYNTIELNNCSANWVSSTGGTMTFSNYFRGDSILNTYSNTVIQSSPNIVVSDNMTMDIASPAGLTGNMTVSNNCTLTFLNDLVIDGSLTVNSSGTISGNDVYTASYTAGATTSTIACNTLILTGTGTLLTQPTGAINPDCAVSEIKVINSSLLSKTVATPSIWPNLNILTIDVESAGFITIDTGTTDTLEVYINSESGASISFLNGTVNNIAFSSTSNAIWNNALSKTVTIIGPLTFGNNIEIIRLPAIIFLNAQTSFYIADKTLVGSTITFNNSVINITGGSFNSAVPITLINSEVTAVNTDILSTLLLKGGSFLINNGDNFFVNTLQANSNGLTTKSFCGIILNSTTNICANLLSLDDCQFAVSGTANTLQCDEITIENKSEVLYSIPILNCSSLNASLSTFTMPSTAGVLTATGNITLSSSTASFLSSMNCAGDIYCAIMTVSGGYSVLTGEYYISQFNCNILNCSVSVRANTSSNMVANIINTLVVDSNGLYGGKFLTANDLNLYGDDDLYIRRQTTAGIRGTFENIYVLSGSTGPKNLALSSTFYTNNTYLSGDGSGNINLTGQTLLPMRVYVGNTGGSAIRIGTMKIKTLEFYDSTTAFLNTDPSINTLTIIGINDANEGLKFGTSSSNNFSTPNIILQNDSGQPNTIIGISTGSNYLVAGGLTIKTGVIAKINTILSTTSSITVQGGGTLTYNLSNVTLEATSLTINSSSFVEFETANILLNTTSISGNFFQRNGSFTCNTTLTPLTGGSAIFGDNISTIDLDIAVDSLINTNTAAQLLIGSNCNVTLNGSGTVYAGNSSTTSINKVNFIINNKTNNDVVFNVLYNGVNVPYGDTLTLNRGNSTGIVSILGNGYWDAFIDKGHVGHTVKFESAKTTFFYNSFTLNGSASNNIALTSTNSLIKTSLQVGPGFVGTVVCNYVDVSHVIGIDKSGTSNEPYTWLYGVGSTITDTIGWGQNIVKRLMFMLLGVG